MDLDDPEIVGKIESIFMPYMANEKRKLKETNNQFVHYTSADNAIKIISSKQLWMRSPKCMNDYMEISHGHRQLVNFFNTKKHRTAFDESLNLIEEGIAQTILNSFDEWWQKIQFDTFISSISVHPRSENLNGRLSMWRAYGEQPAKAALVLNNPPEPIKPLQLLLSPAAYFTYEELENELLSVVKNIKTDLDFIMTLDKEIVKANIILALIVLAVCLKHPGFKEEKEWRVIHLPAIFPPNELILSGVESIGGVPQVVHKIPLENSKEKGVRGLGISDLIDKVIIGPTQYPLALHGAFSAALSDAGVDNADSRIIISDIPLRT